jgi:TatD DNase family protein
MFIDTHLHLADAQFDADRGAIILRALDAKVATWIEIAESPEMWDAAVALAARYPHVYASLGIHPHHAHLYGADEWPGLEARLRDLFKNPKVVAVGEFGLDYFRMQNTQEQQHFLFRKQLEFARSVDKPIVIHCREAQAPQLGAADPAASAHRDIQSALIEFFPEKSLEAACAQPNGVIHCFSGTWEDAQTYMMHGFMLGVDGPVTYPSAKLLQQNVLRMPLQRLVLETDSPYLPPQSHRGKRNEPAHIPVIAEQIALIRHKPLEEIARQTTANARALFRLPS